MMMQVMRDVRQRVVRFQQSAHEVLSRHENSSSRVIFVDQTRRQLQGLSLLQQELFDEALVCIERGLYRAAHVMAWAGFIDLVEQQLASDGFAKLHANRPKWRGYTTVELLRENVADFQILEAARDVGLLGKSQTKTLLGLLAKRNECAHPSDYVPTLNEALGYVTELLNRSAALTRKAL